MALTQNPTGADLCSGTTAGDTLPAWSAGYEEREISFGAGTELTSGTTYAIVIRALTAVDGDSDVVIAYVNPGAYANGNYSASTDSGGAWTGNERDDLWFKTKAGAVEKDTYTPAVTNFDSVAGVNWSAQTFTASSTYTITSVILKLERFFWDTTGNLTVSIKAVLEVPTKATTPSPTDANTSVTLDQATISWVDGGSSDTYNVYYGTTSGSLSLVSSAQAGLSYTVTGITNGSPYNYIVTRYWRIDSTNDAGTVTGDEWSFTTLRFTPPGVTYQHTDGTYYRLLVQSDGSYGDIPGVGVENTDYVVVTYEPNFIRTNRVLVAIAENRFWYENIT